MFFNDKIIYNKLKLLVLLVLAVNYGFGQNYATCVAAGVGAASVTVNGACKVVQIVVGSTTIEAPTGTPSCFPSAPTMDCWFRFVLTAAVPSLTISVNSTNANFGFGFVVYNSCPGVAEVGCVNLNPAVTAHTEILNLGALPAGTYYGRILKNGGTSTNVTPLTVCIKTPVVNDEPAGAIALPTVNSSCSNTIMNLKYASQSTCAGSLVAPSCGWIGASQDVWYSVQVPPSGNLFLQTNYSGTTDLGIASYTGTPCASLTQIGCSEGSPEGAVSGDPSLNVPGLAAGTTVYIRVWNKVTNTVLTTTSTTAPPTYSLCATDLGPCGNSSNNDWCSNPASMSPSAGTFSSSTTATGSYSYTPDSPGDLTTAAGVCSNSFDHNSWYSFIATATTQTFAINVSATNCAGGMSAQVFSVTPNLYGCCKTFSTVSGSCLNAVTGSNTLTASTLSVGGTYHIMMESYGGSSEACTYTVSGWSATGILPIELVSFYGENRDEVNYIQWITSSEKNADAYILESSSDGMNFEKVSQVQAIKNSSISQQLYQTYDSHPYKELTYYRLRQVKLGGISDLSHIISVLGPDFYETIHNLYPNPTNSDLNFDFYSKANNSLKIELLGYAGDVIYETKYVLEEGNNAFVVPMNMLSNGVYILKVVSEKSGKTTHHKIIKN